MDPRKILERTLSGAALAGSLALLLVWNQRSASGLVLLVATALVLGAAVIELSRMGRLRALGLCPALVLAAVATVGLGFAAWQARQAGLAIRDQPGWNVSEALSGAHDGGYGRAALFAFLLATGVHALGIALRNLRWVAWLVGLGLCAFVLHAPLAAGSHVLPGALLAGVLVLGALPATLGAGRGRELAVAGVLALWISAPLPFLASIHARYGTPGLVALLAISKIGDTAGYYGGSAFGKRHPFPGISPGKTEWGCVASFLAATALALALHAAGVLPSGRFGIYGALLTGASLNLAAQAGDLFESWVKRGAGVKDSSSWFGPSGGLLDQLDSFLFTIPLAAATWPWIMDL